MKQKPKQRKRKHTTATKAKTRKVRHKQIVLTKRGKNYGKTPDHLKTTSGRIRYMTHGDAAPRNATGAEVAGFYG